MMTIDVGHKQITVLGAARSGIAAARLLKRSGAQVFVSDIADRSQKSNEINELEEAHIEYEFGSHSDRIFEADLVVLSPGIPAESQTVRQIRKKGIPVLSEIEVASWFCEAPVIAVTGSNGKTTTTMLIGEMLKMTYPKAIIAGNIGQPFAGYVDGSREAGWAVVEVSSFQLETIDRFHPKVAVVLNFAPNHLDRYLSYADYIRAKWRITRNLEPEDLLVYNGNDIQLGEWAAKVNCRKECFRLEREDAKGAYFSANRIYVHGQKLISVNDMILRGKHNFMNAMAAALASFEAGVSYSDMARVLQAFKGVEHRMEFVREWNGIRFFNDSKATTVESLSYAIQSFSDPVILIAGGKDKGSDFSRLNKLIAKHVRDLILIGTAADKMENTWKSIKPTHRADSLQDAVSKACELANKKDVVLLSPACASFDMFRDFEDRGRQFKEVVNVLP